MSSLPWQGQVEINQAIVAEILSKNLPKLIISELKLLGSGWDNSVWLVNQKWCFRFPKKKAAAELLLNEIDILSVLPRLPLAKPEPEFIVKNPEGFEFPFYGHKLVGGYSADRSSLTLADRAKLAIPLAQFLKALHATPLDQFASRTKDGTAERFNFELMLNRVEQGLRASLGKIDNPEAILRYFKKHLEQSIPKDRVLGHGDFYARHILLDAEKNLCGVIDWGDCEILSPAIDLAIAYQFLPKESQDDFWFTYGEVSGAIKTLAKLRAIYSSATLVWYGTRIGDEQLAKEGLQGLVFLK